MISLTGVDISGVVTDPPHSSGVAVIAVDASAENSIIIVPGANGQVGPDDIARLDPVLGDARVFLLQLEVPLDAVVAALSSSSIRPRLDRSRPNSTRWWTS